MKSWHLYYWNKHQCEWQWIGMAEGETKTDAIRFAKSWLPEAVKRGDVMKVVEYDA